MGRASWTLTLLVCCRAGALAAQPPPTPKPSPHPEAPLVSKFAPVLWLADDETIYPTLPHTFAFDDKDNATAEGGQPGSKDLNDPCEIDLDYLADAHRPCEARSKKKVEELVEFFRELEDDRRPPPVVLYSGPFHQELHRSTIRLTGSEYAMLESSAADALGAALRRNEVVSRSDELSFKYQGGVPVHSWILRGHRTVRARDERIQAGTPEREATIRQTFRLRLQGRRLKVFQSQDRIEFWFYYLYDQGINGHRHDSEHAFVYVDCQGGLGHGSDDPRTPELLGDVRGVVGAGHEEHSANNILVAPYWGGEGAVWPRRLSQRTVILVELGKHASAPDRNLDGRFDFGVDANVFAENVWGTRDVQSANTGRIKLEKFKTWYSFPRSRAGALCEEETSKGEEYEQSGLGGLCTKEAKQYRLFPADDLEELHRLLEREDRSGVESHLSLHSTCFWGREREVLIEDEVWTRMRKWPQSRAGERNLARRDVWTHDDHKNPDHIFKLFLFPHMRLGLLSKAEGGNWVTGASVQLAQINFNIPPLNWIPGLKHFLAGPILNDSTLEGHLTWDNLSILGRRIGPTSLYDVGLTLNSFRGRYAGFYAGLQWRFPQATQTTHLRASAGLAFGIPSLKVWKLPRFSITLKAGLHGEPSQTEDKRSEPVTVQLALAVQFNLGGWIEPRHPLKY